MFRWTCLVLLGDDLGSLLFQKLGECHLGILQQIWLNLAGGDGSMPLQPLLLLVLTLDRREMCGQGRLPITVPLPLLCLLLRIPQTASLLHLFLSPIVATVLFVSGYPCARTYIHTPLLVFTVCFLSHCIPLSRRPVVSYCPYCNC